MVSNLVSGLILLLDRSIKPGDVIVIGETYGWINALAARKANLNLGNSSGETPLIRAVQLRNLDMVRALVAAGANPDQADVIAGLSARDYAKRDTRTPALLKLLDEAPTAKPKAAVAGPRI